MGYGTHGNHWIPWDPRILLGSYAAGAATPSANVSVAPVVGGAVLDLFYGLTAPPVAGVMTNDDDETEYPLVIITKELRRYRKIEALEMFIEPHRPDDPDFHPQHSNPAR